MRSVRALLPILFCSLVAVAQQQPPQSFRDLPARPITAASQAAAQPAKAPETAEQKTARALEAARANDGALYAFLLEMPKGGDLHNHITGAAYAESYIRWAAADGLCLDRASHTLTPPPCKEAQIEAKAALSDPRLYGELIDAWSMRHFYGPNSAHDHFFDTFPKFNAVTNAHMGDMMAELATRNHDANLQYLELMTMPDESKSIGFGSKFQYDPNLSAMRQKMLEGGIPQLVADARRNLDAWDAQKNAALHCNDANPNNVDPACSVAIRHDYAVLRAFTHVQVFAQLLLAFELANADPRVVGVNMVQPEDWLVPMRDYTTHMKMISYLHEIYPKVHISLHAGEIAPGLVPPEGLRFHIREAVELGHAERIGHGVDVMYEEDPQHLLAAMARRNVMVEICLTSNDEILGVKGKDHPLRIYMKAGVPVALATDDEGVSRSEITREYQKAVEEQGLDYPMLKNMARTSLEHAFLSGASLWSDARRYTMVKECAGEHPGEHNTSATCKAYLKANDRAHEQWKLEKSFVEFEAKY